MRGAAIRDAWHAALIYDDDQQLSHFVADYVANCNAEDRVVMVCTPEHWSVFSASLKRSSYDVDRALQEGQLTMLDARLTLSRFVRRTLPVENLFRAAIEPVVQRRSTSGPPSRVLVYGEMVDLLCQDGNTPAALALEQFWNDLHETVPFWLLCGYLRDPLRVSPSDMRRVCDAHTHVIRGNRAAQTVAR